MHTIKLHPLVAEDLKQLNNSVRIEIFKKLQKIQTSPQIGKALGNRNGMNLSGFYKVYVAKKQIRIVYEVLNDVLVVHIIAIGKREAMEVYKQVELRKE